MFSTAITGLLDIKFPKLSQNPFASKIYAYKLQYLGNWFIIIDRKQ